MEADRLAGTGMHPALALQHHHSALSPGRSSAVRLASQPQVQAYDTAGAEALMSMLSCDVRDGAEKEGFKPTPRASSQPHSAAAPTAAPSASTSTGTSERGGSQSGKGSQGTPAPSNRSVLSDGPSEEAAQRMAGAVPDEEHGVPALPSIPAATDQAQHLLTARKEEGEDASAPVVQVGGGGGPAMRLRLKTASSSSTSTTAGLAQGQAAMKQSPASVGSGVSALQPPLAALSGGTSTSGGYPIRITAIASLQAQAQAQAEQGVGTRSSPRGALKNSPSAAATGGKGPRSAATVSFADPRLL